MRTIENVDEKVEGDKGNVTETKLVVENSTEKHDVHDCLTEKINDGDSFSEHLDVLESQKKDNDDDDDDEFDIENAFKRM